MSAVLTGWILLPAGLAVAGDSPADPLQPYVEFLKAHGRDPKTLLLDALADHELVIMGEVHHRPTYWAFNAALVSDPRFAQTTGTIYLELPAYDQDRMDRFLDSDPMEVTAAIDVLRDMLWMGWPDRAMLDFMVEVWRMNRRLATDSRLRILLVDAQPRWEQLRAREDLLHGEPDRDEFMAKRILADLRERGGRDGRHALFIVGVGHASLDLRQPGSRAPVKTAGWHLQAELGRDHVFAVFPHMPRQTNMGRVHGRLRGGLFDSALLATEVGALAFPLAGNPFGKEPFDAFPDRSLTGTFEEGYTAYLYLGRLEDEVFSPLIIGFYTDEHVREVSRRHHLIFGKTWEEAYVQPAGAASFAAWLRTTWGQPREEWRRKLGPVDAWRTDRE